MFEKIIIHSGSLTALFFKLNKEAVPTQDIMKDVNEHIYTL